MMRNSSRNWLAGAVCLVVLTTWMSQATAQVTMRLGDEVGETPWEDTSLGWDNTSDFPSAAPANEGLMKWVCMPAGRMWARAEYLHWWMKGNDLPPLVTTSPPGTARADAGVLGVPGTQVLFGGDVIDNDDRSGLRISAGYWLDDCQNRGIQVNYFSVFDDSDTGDFSARTLGGFGSGAPILARPFFDVTAAAENARLVSFPNLVDGQINITSSSEMHSTSVLLRQCFRRGLCGRVDVFGGYRYFRLREGILIEENLVSTATGGTIQQGTTFDIYDHFTAENDFHGGEIGVVSELWRGPFTLELLAKVAIGNVHRMVSVEGGTLSQTPPPVTTTAAQGGLLALSSNIGQRTDNDFAALPEFGVNLSYDYSDRIKFLFGYTLLMLNDVARSGEQIDRGINPTFLPGQVPSGQPRPASQFNDVTDFWAMGGNVGVLIEL